MRHSLAPCWVAAATLIMLLASSTSQAGPFRGAYFSYPVCYSAAAPLQSQAVPPPAGPIVHTSQMPVLPPGYGQTVPPAPKTPVYSPGHQVPAGISGGSNMPRSSWDFGKWPPY
jgi:hypothetical protein